MSLRIPAAALAAGLLLACSLERPDPASQAAAILHKRPSGFLDRLTALDALAAREWEAAFPGEGTAPPALAESVHAHAERLRPALAAAPDPEERIGLLNAFLFDSLGIRPDPADTAFAASVPSLVLARRRGSCVGLVLLYLALGETLDLPFVPVFLPGHVFVRWRGDGTARNVETLRRGIARSDSFYRAAFVLAKRPWYSLADGRPEQALGALVFNLANLHRSRGDWHAAEWEYRLAEEALPGLPEALGNRGAGWLAQGDMQQARLLLVTALAGDSLAEPAWRNLEAIHRAAGDSAGAAEAAAGAARARDGLRGGPATAATGLPAGSPAGEPP